MSCSSPAGHPCHRPSCPESQVSSEQGQPQALDESLRCDIRTDNSISLLLPNKPKFTCNTQEAGNVTPHYVTTHSPLTFQQPLTPVLSPIGPLLSAREALEPWMLLPLWPDLCPPQLQVLGGWSNNSVASHCRGHFPPCLTKSKS